MVVRQWREHTSCRCRGNAPFLREGPREGGGKKRRKEGVKDGRRERNSSAAEGGGGADRPVDVAGPVESAASSEAPWAGATAGNVPRRPLFPLHPPLSRELTAFPRRVPGNVHTPGYSRLTLTFCRTLTAASPAVNAPRLGLTLRPMLTAASPATRSANRPLFLHILHLKLTPPLQPPSAPAADARTTRGCPGVVLMFVSPSEVFISDVQIYCSSEHVTCSGS